MGRLQRLAIPYPPEVARGGSQALSALQNHVEGSFGGAAYHGGSFPVVAVIKPVVSGNILVSISFCFSAAGENSAAFRLGYHAPPFTIAAVAPTVPGIVTAGANVNGLVLAPAPTTYVESDFQLTTVTNSMTMTAIVPTTVLNQFVGFSLEVLFGGLGSGSATIQSTTPIKAYISAIELG